MTELVARCSFCRTEFDPRHRHDCAVVLAELRAELAVLEERLARVTAAVETGDIGAARCALEGVA